jgi:hypothetical protein
VRITILSLATLLALPAQPAAAHHSFAMFDMQKEVKLQGTVKSYQWTNPHVWIQLLVKDASGKEVEWAIECNGISGMVRTGWTRNTVHVGDTMDVIIHPLKTSTEPGGSLTSATINGKTLKVGGGGVGLEGGPGGAP